MSQHIVLPWNTPKWDEWRPKIADRIASIVELDSRISSIYAGKLRPRTIIEMFNAYYGSDEFPDRVPEAVILDKIIPHMMDLVLNGKRIFKTPLRTLPQGPARANIAITSTQAAVLIYCAWIGLFEYNYVGRSSADAAGPKIEDFSEVSLLNIFLTKNMFAFACMLNYFHRVCTDPALATRIIIVQRNRAPTIDWANSTAHICEIYIGGSDGPGPAKIDESPARLHVDFSTEYICGGGFARTLSSEEVLFLIRPECQMATLLCPKVHHSEAVCVFGAEKFSQYEGRLSTLRFAGNYHDRAPRGRCRAELMLQNVVICIDAAPVVGPSQYIGMFLRDLNKAFCGFSAVDLPEKVATGNWSYGAFGSNQSVKFIQQVLAASETGKSLVYYPSSEEFENQLVPFIEWLQRVDWTVGELFAVYNDLMKTVYKGANSRLGEVNIFTAISGGDYQYEN